MIRDPHQKIEDYTFTDFSEEFGYVYEGDEEKRHFVNENDEVLFTISRVGGEDAGAGNEDLQDLAGTDDAGMEAPADTEVHTGSSGNLSAADLQAASRDRQEAEQLLASARIESERIIKEAREAAELIRNNAVAEAGEALSQAEQTGYNEGFEKGQTEGFQSAYDDTRRELDEQNKSLLEEISRAIAELERQKTDFIRQYNEEMKDLVIAIAEKVMKISLKSSGEVIRRMILAAVENSSQKEWAKIYISEYDANLMVREDTDILDALRRVSDHIKVITMENGEPGDLIVEYPDQAVDAGVNTQLENIRKIMEDN